MYHYKTISKTSKLIFKTSVSYRKGFQASKMDFVVRKVISGILAYGTRSYVTIAIHLK